MERMRKTPAREGEGTGEDNKECFVVYSRDQIEENERKRKVKKRSRKRKGQMKAEKTYEL